MNEPRPRILVVDDSAPYLEFMHLLLTAEGFDVTTATTAETALDALRQARPQLIISDALLPGLPAFAILDLLAGEKAAQGIPVLICTGAQREARAFEAQGARDGVDLLLKPFEIEVLLDRVARLCPPGKP